MYCDRDMIKTHLPCCGTLRRAAPGGRCAREICEAAEHLVLGLHAISLPAAMLSILQGVCMQ